MRILINDNSVETTSTAMLLTVLKATEHALDGCAIAINNKVVPRSQWRNTALNANDHITVFRAISGG